MHAICYSTFWAAIRAGGVALVVLAIGAFLLPEELGDLGRAADDVAQKFDADLAGYGLAIVGMVGLVAGWVGKKNSERHIWIECKDRREPIKRKDVQKLVMTGRDVAELADHDWNPNELWLVSTVRFDQDAAAVAVAERVRCFLVVGDEFIEQ